MKISCNIIEDLLPLYVDDMVSEDSRQLVEEHLKACPTCRRMQEEIMRENHLTDVKKGSDSVQTNKMEAELLKKFAVRFVKRELRRYSWQLPLFWQPVESGIIGIMIRKITFPGTRQTICKGWKSIFYGKSIGKDEINSVRRPEKHVLHAVRNHVDPQRISIRFKHRK